MLNVKTAGSKDDAATLKNETQALYAYMTSKCGQGRTQVYLTYTAATTNGLRISPSAYKTAIYELVAKKLISPCKQRFKYTIIKQKHERASEFDRSAEPDFWSAATPPRQHDLL